MKMKKLILFLITTSLYMHGFSMSFFIDGVTYKVLNEDLRTCSAANAKSVVKFPEDLIIPDEVTYDNINYVVTEIENKGFFGSHLKTLSIGNNVETINAQAFGSCLSLTNVTIGTSVASIGSFAFAASSNLTSVNITDLEAWCNISFYDNGANPLYFAHNLYIDDQPVTNLQIPTSVNQIKNYAFIGFSGMSSLDIHNSVTSIGVSAFSDCSGISSLTLPNSITVIDEKAFSNCTNLNYLTISNSIPEFSHNAFVGCSNLSTITLNKEVGNLGSVNFPSSVRIVTSSNPIPPTITNSTFNSETTQNGVLLVPESAITAYQYSPYWTDFRRIEAIPNTGSGGLDDPNNDNIFNSEIDKYIYMELDEEISFADYLPSGSSASSWESSDEDIVEVTKKGKAEAYEYGNVIVRALDGDGESIITLGVFVCPTVKIHYGTGKTYQHHVIYNSTPNLFIAAPDGYEIVAVSHNGEDVTGEVKANDGYYSPATPIKSNSTITVTLNSTAIPGDLNGDGKVDSSDLNWLLDQMMNF